MKARWSQWITGAAAVVVTSVCAAATHGDPKVALAGEVLGSAIHTRDAEELRYFVLKGLTDRYAAEKGITVTSAEITAYVSKVQDSLQQDRARNLARRDELTRKLAVGGLSESERKVLAAELDTVNMTIAALGASGPAQSGTEDTKAREQIAAAFIRQWKINRALYQQYGGRIIFQQGGPEPLDAYRLFLEQQQAQGNFKILNKDLEPAFWRYFVTDSIHSFYPRGSIEESQAFSVPWWQAK
jgi:hypothetical protein